jgi:hypothetical protein
MQRAVLKRLRCRLSVLAALCVDQVGGRNIGQRLGGRHILRSQLTGCLPVQVECAEPTIAVPQREGEDRNESCSDRCTSESREAIVGIEVCDGDRHARLERRDARTLPDAGLQLFESQRGFIGRGDVPRRVACRNQGHSGRGDRQDFDDTFHQMVQDRLNREVGGHRVRKLSKDGREFLFVDHDVTSLRHPRMDPRSLDG